MEAFGRGLVSEPFLSTVVIGAPLIAECGTEAQQQAHPAERRRRCADARLRPFGARGALRPRHGRHDRHARRADGWRLNGSKIAVLDGAAAGQIIVSARVADGNGASGKLGLFLVPAGAPGAHSARLCAARRRSRPAISISTDVQLPADALLGDGSDALPAIEAVVDRAMAALGAEAVGIMQTLLDTTLEYTKIRKQFGRPAVGQPGDPPSPRRHGDAGRRGALDGAARAR